MFLRLLNLKRNVLIEHHFKSFNQKEGFLLPILVTFFVGYDDGRKMNFWKGIIFDVQ